MEVFRADGHLTDEVLAALTADLELEELTRLELAEHLAFCDYCLQRYTGLLENTLLEMPTHSCRETLWGSIRRRTVQLLSQRYATAAAAVALALTLLWGSGSPAFLAAEEKIEAALAPHTETWPERWNQRLDAFSGQLQEFFEDLPSLREDQKGDSRP